MILVKFPKSRGAAAFDSWSRAKRKHGERCGCLVINSHGYTYTITA